MNVRSLSILGFAGAVALTGCSKLKAMKGGGDGGAGESAGGGGLLSALKPSPLEGAVDVSIAQKNKAKPEPPMNLHLEMKPEKIRIDFPTAPPGQKSELDQLGTGYAVINSAEKKIYVVMDKEKQVLVIDLNKKFEGPKMPSTPNAKSAGGTPTDNTKVTKTGKIEKVAGYDCEDWDIQSEDGSKATVCMAKALSFISLPLSGLAGLGGMAPGGGIGGKAGLMAQLFSGSFPLKMVSYDKVGTEEADIEATKIDKKTIDDARFAIPPTYKTMDLEQMLGGMGGGMRPPTMPPHR